MADQDLLLTQEHRDLTEPPRARLRDLAEREAQLVTRRQDLTAELQRLEPAMARATLQGKPEPTEWTKALGSLRDVGRTLNALPMERARLEEELRVQEVEVRRALVSKVARQRRRLTERAIASTRAAIDDVRALTELWTQVTAIYGRGQGKVENLVPPQLVAMLAQFVADLERCLQPAPPKADSGLAVIRLVRTLREAGLEQTGKAEVQKLGQVLDAVPFSFFGRYFRGDLVGVAPAAASVLCKVGLAEVFRAPPEPDPDLDQQAWQQWHDTYISVDQWRARNPAPPEHAPVPA